MIGYGYMNVTRVFSMNVYIYVKKYDISLSFRRIVRGRGGRE